MNSSPTLTQGCSCNNGFYNKTSLSAADSCLACYSDCKTCNVAFLCLTCIDLNAYPTLTQGCACNQYFYNTTALTTINSCKPCLSDCITCNSSSLCITCISSNAFPTQTQGCLCNEAFFNTTALNTSNACISCYYDCSTCNDSLKCMSCITLNSSPTSTKGCICNQGYYNISSLTSTDACIRGNSECSTSADNETCSTCISLNASPAFTSNITCICNPKYWGIHPLNDLNSCMPCNQDCATCTDNSTCITCLDPNAFVNQNICTCNNGYYNISNSPLTCKKCSSECLTCNNLMTCTMCAMNFSNPTLFGTCQCPSNSFIKNNSACECNDGYYMEYNISNLSYYCNNCNDSCKTCTRSDFCLSCSNSNQVLNINTGICFTDCETGKYLNNNNCVNCLNLCSDCINNTYCNQCIDNATLIDYSICQCNKGYQLSNNLCIISLFYANLTVISTNIIEIAFTEAPVLLLNFSDFYIEMNISLSFDYNVKMINPSLYRIQFIFKSQIQENLTLSVAILPYVIYSINNSQLKNYNFSVSFAASYAFQSYPSVQTVVKTSSIAAKSAVAISVAIGIISNPASAWILINTIQFITYLPLGSNQLTPNLNQFCTSIGGNVLIPNIFIKIFKDDSTSSPYNNALQYGLSTSVFWINIGPDIMNLLIFLAPFPIIYILSKLLQGKISSKFSLLLDNYKYSVFLRYWIQSYLDIGIFSFVQLRSVII